MQDPGARIGSAWTFVCQSLLSFLCEISTSKYEKFESFCDWASYAESVNFKLQVYSGKNHDFIKIPSKQ